MVHLNAVVVNGVCVLSTLLSSHGVFAQGSPWDTLGQGSQGSQGSQPAPAPAPQAPIANDPWSTLGGGSGGTAPPPATDPWATLGGGGGGAGGNPGTGNPSTGGGSSNNQPIQQNVQITTTPNCNSDNDKVYEAADGSWFKLQCVTHNWYTSNKNRITASSYQDCVDKCSTTDGCEAITYEHANGACDIMQGPYDPNSQSVPCNNHHFAYAIDPPTYPAAVEKRTLCSVECPEADGMIYTTDHGEVYKMSCGKRHGTTPIGGEIVNSLKECMDACSSVLQCHSVDYHPRTKKCYQSNHQSDPTVQASGFASAHSLGCANACNGGCGCSSGACQQKVTSSAA